METACVKCSDKDCRICPVLNNNKFKERFAVADGIGESDTYKLTSDDCM